MKGHRIEKKIEIEDFLDIINNIDEKEINTTDHTFFRLSETQRKVFKDRILKDFIKGQNPILVGIQYNGCYTAFYNYSKDEALRVIMDITGNKCDIVTFYIIAKNQIPRI